MTPLTQTRRAAPLAGDGNGNPSPGAVPDPQTLAALPLSGRGLRAARPSLRVARSIDTSCGDTPAGFAPVKGCMRLTASTTVPQGAATAGFHSSGECSHATPAGSEIPGPNPRRLAPASPSVAGPASGNCGRSLRDRAGRTFIQTRAPGSSLPAAREAGHGSGAADPVDAGPAANSETV
ncbi:hypothetical protein SAMN05216258_1105 [Albimonas pacifica]|uniref:Uncharacterized protein n=1 Tax=Albimonas pacifica TaxID=1114924 RepID=A0A1I3LFY1_9RHOB|nr:hypothetical protein SAMN05216258_1105 [Albimonas pacifica]